MGAETKTKLAIAALSALVVSSFDDQWEFVFSAFLAGSWLACSVQKSLHDLWLLAGLSYIVAVSRSQFAASACAFVLIAAPITGKIQVRYSKGMTAG